MPVLERTLRYAPSNSGGNGGRRDKLTPARTSQLCGISGERKPFAITKIYLEHRAACYYNAGLELMGQGKSTRQINTVRTRLTLIPSRLPTLMNANVASSRLRSIFSSSAQVLVKQGSLLFQKPRSHHLSSVDAGAYRNRGGLGPYVSLGYQQSDWTKSKLINTFTRDMLRISS